MNLYDRLSTLRELIELLSRATKMAGFLRLNTGGLHEMIDRCLIEQKQLEQLSVDEI